MSIEEQIAGRIKDSGMSIKAVSSKTGIPYSSLQPSLIGRRPLRAEEFISICGVLKLTTEEFLDRRGL